MFLIQAEIKRLISVVILFTCLSGDCALRENVDFVGFNFFSFLRLKTRNEFAKFRRNDEFGVLLCLQNLITRPPRRFSFSNLPM